MSGSQGTSAVGTTSRECVCKTRHAPIAVVAWNEGYGRYLMFVKGVE